MTQKEKIKSLEIQLKEAKANTYIYETNHLQCSNGELHIGFGDYGDNERWLVWNVNSLFNDLPYIISQVVREQSKMQGNQLKNIQEVLKEINIK